MDFMIFEEFIKLLGLKCISTGWSKEKDAEESDPMQLKVDGPYIDEFGEMICAVRIPDDLWLRIREYKDRN